MADNGNIVDIVLKLSVDDSDLKGDLDTMKQAFSAVSKKSLNQQLDKVNERVREIRASAIAVQRAMSRMDKSRGKSKSSAANTQIDEKIKELMELSQSVSHNYSKMFKLDKDTGLGEAGAIQKEQAENFQKILDLDARIQAIDEKRLALTKQISAATSQLSKKQLSTAQQIESGQYEGSGKTSKKVSEYLESKRAIDEESEALSKESNALKQQVVDLGKRNTLLGALAKDEERRNKYVDEAVGKQIEISDAIEKQSSQIEVINKELGDIVNKSGVLPDTANEVTKSVRRTSGAMKNVLTLEQRTAKASLKNARDTASANYYVLRSLKMTIKEVDNLTKKVRSLEKTILGASRSGLKGLLKLGLGFKKLSKHMSHSTSSHKGFVGSMKIGFRTILKYTFGIRSFYFLLNKLRRALGESMGVLAQSSAHVNEQMSSLLSNVSWMKNMMATVAQPLLNVLVPAMDIVANAFDRATKAIASFFATLTGQSFIYRAIKPTEDYAAALDKTGNSAKKAKDNIQSFDELHVIDDSNGSGGADSGKFETAEIETAYSEVAQRVKDILGTIFEPIKKAWDSEGNYVITAWKNGLNEVLALGKQIGKDFLTVWSNDTGVRIWENIWHILGDIGQITANLAKNFNDAWKNADKGLHIFEGLQMLVDIVIQGIRDMADATVEWSENLDFNPLLQETLNLINLLAVPVFHIVNILTDFWNNVVLPFRAYMVEEGLPKLLQTLQQIVGAVDWQLLEERMHRLMEAFEPFLETVWEGLLIVLDDLGQKLADFVNSDGFGYLIDKLIDFMNNASPEDVAKKIEGIAKAILEFHLALIALKGVLGGIEAIRTFLNFFMQAKVLKNVKELNKAMGVESGLTAVISKLGRECQTWGGIIKNSLAVGGTSFTKVFGPAGVLAGAVVVLKNFVKMWKEGFNWINEIGVLLGSVLITIGLIVAGVAAFPAVIIGAVVAAVTTVAVLIHDHWEEIKEKFSGVADWFNEHIVQPLLNFLSPIIEWFKGLWQTVKDIFTSIGVIAEAVVTIIRDRISTRINEIKSFFSGLWTAIKTGVSDTWNKSIKPILTPIGQWIYKWVISPISKFFSNLWDGLVTGIKIAINAAIILVESFVNFIIDAINGFLSGLEKIAQGASKITGKDYSGITKIEHVNLPRLAQGAVIPPNKEFLAVLGDQKSGTNIEAPLDTIKQALAEVISDEMLSLLAQQVSLLQDIYEKETDVNIGDEEIARASVRGQRKLGRVIRTS